MSEVESAATLGATRLGFADEKDVDQFVETLEKFERGEITSDDWRTFRLLNGVYGQRQADRTMLRIKIPQGILTAQQLDALGDIAERWANGKGHITTRQNIQFHFVKWEDADTALYHAAASGLTTREACSNSVRNITQCPYAGVSALEPFDSGPYAEALTRFLLRGPWSSGLPRKFKIAFSGCCGTDCVGGHFNDMGFFARIVDGQRGFRIVAGGGLATLRRNAVLLHEFVPAEEIFEVAEAVARVFHRTGDRQHKHKARLKFVIDKIGAPAFLAEYQKERDNVRADGGRLFKPAPPTPALKLKAPPARAAHRELPKFIEKNVRPQSQSGYSAVAVKLTLGDLTAPQFHAIANLARTFSAEEEVRLTMEQNFLFRFVRDQDVPALHQELVALDLADAGPSTVLDVTSCPGAMSCKLAVTQSRGIALLVQDYLQVRPDLAAKAEKLSIKASGCPNSCGQHHASGIGFQGGLKKIGGKALPLYHVYVGGHLGLDKTSFGRIAAKVPARRAGLFVGRLIELYDAEKRPGELPDSFFERVSVDRIKAVSSDLTEIDESTARPEDFVDLGEQQAFEPELQEGECAA